MTVWNQHSKLPALQLNLVRCLFISFLFSLTLLFVDWPVGWGFYSGAVIAGLASCVTSTSLFYSAKEHTAHLASLFMPLAMVFTFVAWLPFDMERLDALLAKPYSFALIILAMLVTNITVFKMRHIRFTHTSFIGLVLLNAFVIALSQIWVKKTTSNSLDAVLVLSFIIFVVQAMGSAAWMRVQNIPIELIKLNKNIVVLSVVSALSCICSWYAVILAPDPSLFTAVLLAGPFLLTLYHRYHDHDISESLVPGAVITLSSIVIVFLSL